MRENDKFYKVEMLVSRKDIDMHLEGRDGGPASFLFNRFSDVDLKIYELRTNKVSARIVPEHITIVDSCPTNIVTRNGFDRHSIDSDDALSEAGEEK